MYRIYFLTPGFSLSVAGPPVSTVSFHPGSTESKHHQDTTLFQSFLWNLTCTDTLHCDVPLSALSSAQQTVEDKNLIFSHSIKTLRHTNWHRLVHSHVHSNKWVTTGYVCVCVCVYMCLEVMVKAASYSPLRDYNSCWDTHTHPYIHTMWKRLFPCGFIFPFLSCCYLPIERKSFNLHFSFIYLFGHVTCGTDQIHSVWGKTHQKAFTERSAHEPLTFWKCKEWFYERKPFCAAGLH